MRKGKIDLVQLIGAAKVIENVRNCGQIESNCTTVQRIGELPERQLRPLTHLEPEEQREDLTVRQWASVEPILFGLRLVVRMVMKQGQVECQACRHIGQTDETGWMSRKVV